MEESYKILSKKDSRELTQWLAREGQFLLPMLDLIEQAEAAVDEVFGLATPVQWCRKHKMTNVMDHLPEALKDQVKGVLQAAWRMEPEEGKKQIRHQARQLEDLHPSTAGSLLEGLDELFRSMRCDCPKP
ncbi:MAG TPA: hypothetical protein P5017_08215 [Anaerohalosphaeraceae bacterium]|nr:hypothetical protein [Anaerohalosphaeraceae bacterium]